MVSISDSGQAILCAQTNFTFAGSEFARQMEVFQAAGNRPGKRIVRLDTINNQVQRSLSAGTFFVKITGTASSGLGGSASFAGLISLFS
ncbi:MAG: hypothetical protein HC895_08450 [Leptolyngbyaceae cyanobacterium SM1_3_5]|nr:hypothetical protein [Leptolyngbyaceae cyanobacterium SM1_3_5]